MLSKIKNLLKGKRELLPRICEVCQTTQTLVNRVTDCPVCKDYHKQWLDEGAQGTFEKYVHRKQVAKIP